MIEFGLIGLVYRPLGEHASLIARILVGKGALVMWHAMACIQ